MTTRWLTDEEQRTWRLFLTACQSVFGAIEGQLLRDSGLPHGYYEILVHLSEAPGRALRMSQLAAASTYSKSRLSHAVSKLEERGLVVRLDCPTDRRGQIAQLTEQGFAVLDEAAHWSRRPGSAIAHRCADARAGGSAWRDQCRDGRGRYRAGRRKLLWGRGGG